MNYYYYLIIFFVIVSYVSIIFIKHRKVKQVKGLDYRTEGRNIALGMTHCKKLHKELVKLIHPDKVNEEMRPAADLLMQEINAAKYDYNRLVALKSEVFHFLNK